MMKFGIKITEKKVYLVDLDTGEILTEDRCSVNEWLNRFQDYTLTLID